MKSVLKAFAATAIILSQPSDATETPAVASAPGHVVQPPAGWAREQKERVVRYDAPEGDLVLAIVELDRSADAATATRQAWALVRPDDRLVVKQTTKVPPRRGWDERLFTSYESAPSAHRVRYAYALRHDDTWTVLIVDGSQATFEKREAAISAVQASLHPVGYVKENFANRPANRLDAVRIAAMRSFVQTSINALGIPGASFALIERGKVVHESGLGAKKLGFTERVDAETLFMVASNTKAMTSLLLAQLVDRGRLSWTMPVIDAYPAFRLGDAATTRSIEIRHLVCACTGLPRKELEWVLNTPADTPASATFTQLARITPTSRLGEIFQYNNQIVSAAGYVAGHLLYPDMELGAAYDRAMQTRIFDPLGMGASTFSFEKATAGNHASPHSDDITGRATVSDLALDKIVIPQRPLGGAWSSAHDLIKFVGLELSRGVLPDGRRLVSEANLLARRARGIPTGENRWYGMGLEEDISTGVSVIHHGGNMPGYQSDIIVIPGAQVGAVILTNSSRGASLLGPFRRRLLELLYDGRPDAAADIAFEAGQHDADAASERDGLTVPAEPTIVSRLAASYSNPELGPLTVRPEPGGTRLVFRALSSMVGSRRNADGSVALVPIDPGAVSVSLVVGSANGRPTLTAREGQHDYVFEAVTDQLRDDERP